MTPGARVAAAIEILDKISAGVAAEQALTAWARGSRYAGSKDRAAVRDQWVRIEPGSPVKSFFRIREVLSLLCYALLLQLLQEHVLHSPVHGHLKSQLHIYLLPC